MPFKHELLKRIWMRFHAGQRRDLLLAYEEFCYECRSWLEDYALFRALKEQIQRRVVSGLAVGIVERKPAALDKVRGELADEIDQVRLAAVPVILPEQTAEKHARAEGCD